MAKRKTKEEYFDELSSGHQKHILSKVIVALGGATMSALPEDKGKREELLRKAGVSTALENDVKRAFVSFYGFSSLKRDPEIPKNNYNPAVGVVGISFSKSIRQKAALFLENSKRQYPERSYHIKSYSVGSVGEGNKLAIPNKRYDDASVRYRPIKILSIVEDNPFTSNRSARSDNTELMSKLGIPEEVYSQFSGGPDYGEVVAYKLSESELFELVDSIGREEFAADMKRFHIPPTGAELEELSQSRSLWDYIDYTNQDVNDMASKLKSEFEQSIKPRREQAIAVQNNGRPDTLSYF